MAVAAVAGCGLSLGGRPLACAAVASATWDLHIENGTTRAVTILVDGATVATVPAGGSASVAESTLRPGLVRSGPLPGGRTVLKAQIDRRPPFRRGWPRGPFLRSARPLGAAPMLGPAPGPGTPGDCDG